jgi:hypothetical protein
MGVLQYAHRKTTNQIGFWSEIKLEIIRREKDGYDAADRSWRLRF